MKLLVPLVIALALAVQPACYGSYSAFHTVHTWNGHATGNRFINSAIHFGMWILPVYQLVLAADFFVFNNIEFITEKPVFH